MRDMRDDWRCWRAAEACGRTCGGQGGCQAADGSVASLLEGWHLPPLRVHIECGRIHLTSSKWVSPVYAGWLASTELQVLMLLMPDLRG